MGNGAPIRIGERTTVETDVAKSCPRLGGKLSAGKPGAPTVSDGVRATRAVRTSAGH